MKAAEPTGAGLLQRAEFAFGAAELALLPPDRCAEVAIAGRSNAGKSSAINALTGRRKLAFVSKTPGRTQQINYYALGERCYLVDLPGYGYARVAGDVQRKWERILPAYLRLRASLRGLVIIMDARHPLTLLDQRMLEWFAVTGKPCRILLSKADKLSRQEQTKQLRQLSETLEAQHAGVSAQLFSSVSGLGVEQARAFVVGLLEESQQPAAERLESGAEKKNPRLKGKTGG
jgi:GTP-binding protein